jgi:DNA modification methylase/ParB-like chromosome segregation protein Spo0J
MLVPFTDIFVAPDADRIRDQENLQNAAKEKARSLLRFGQLQPVLVEKSREGVDRPWTLIDGKVRLTAMMSLTIRHMMGEEDVRVSFDKWGMSPGHVEVISKDSLDPLTALMMEFHANEDRDNFTWDEKAKYVRRIHDMLKAQGGKEWGQEETAEAIGMSPASVSQYLQLTEAHPAAQSERVQKATTKGAALKQLKIEKERHVRQERAKIADKPKAAPSTSGGGEAPPVQERRGADAARLSTHHGDCREWIKSLPDGSLDWFHWDPPYGGAEGAGGAFASHTPIQTEHEYALQLMDEMFPEIWRVLSDGGWLVLWYTPVHYNRIRLALQGHEFGEDGTCRFCERHLQRDYVWLSTNYSCRKSPHRFWVNPYPNYWRKKDRTADGHEITRFLTKETEPFFLAGKQDAKTPILLRSDRGNVFEFDGVPTGERRHVHHKPSALLKEILSLVSVPGGLGADPSAGSGSIIEATYQANRKIVTCELDEKNHSDCLSVAIRELEKKDYSPEQVARWLAPST